MKPAGWITTDRAFAFASAAISILFLKWRDYPSAAWFAYGFFFFLHFDRR